MTISALHQFPQGFLWGCATAAHQVEGQNYNDWWRWEREHGRIFQNQQSGFACDWWSGRFVEDFDRAAGMNNNAQRISIEWSRIEPEPGKWDDYAIGRYRDMLQALVDRGMKPMVTLHHFTNPLWIADRDGWLWDEVPTYFGRYVRKVVESLGDLCSFWCTINEPMVYATQSYSFGKWPPGMRSGSAVNRVTLNLLKGHAAAYHEIKAIQPNSEVGLAMHIVDLQPMSPAFIHGMAASLVEGAFNRGFILALLDGRARLVGMRHVDVPNLKGTLDWIGLQYYQHYRVGFDLRTPSTFFIRQRKPTDMPVGPSTWGGLKPEAIYTHIKWLHKNVKKPIYVTESGVPDPDDTIRPAYLLHTLYSIWQATNYGFDVRGFFFWSLLDNFEWAEGFDPRFSFGLFKTDFATHERTARPSAGLYGEVCRMNGFNVELVERYAPKLVPILFPGDAGQDNVKLKAK